MMCRRKYWLKYYIEEENYQKVILLILEYQKEAKLNGEYADITALHINITDVFDLVEESLDSSLSKMCVDFNFDKYTDIQHAYNFLGKSQSAINQLHMHFTATINTVSFNCVKKYSNVDKQREYQHVCKTVSIDNFMVCLMTLCKSLLKILKSYFLIFKWHKSVDVPSFSKDAKNSLISNENDIFNKFQNDIRKIFLDIENKIIIFIDVFDFISFEFEKLLEILNIVDSIFKIEKKVCEKFESKLHKYILEKFVIYFDSYHVSRLEELRIFLENESWKLCPVKSSFKITQLREFQSFKYASNSNYIISIFKSLQNKHENNVFSTDSICDGLHFLDTTLDRSSEESILQTYEETWDNNIVISTNVKRAVSRIKDSLLLKCSTITKNFLNTDQANPPLFSNKTGLNDPNLLFGLAERIVSTESLIFLGHQYETFQSYLYSVISEHEDKVYLNMFYNNTVLLSVQLRKPIYMVSISKFFDAKKILSLMSRVNWELKDVMSLHNTYIDVLIQKMKKFQEKLEEMQNCIVISDEVHKTIWEGVAEIITHTMVEGFSEAKKCTNGGRALMLLDFTQLVSKFEGMTSLRPMPHQDFVSTYIKAYYLPELNVESWIKNHTMLESPISKFALTLSVSTSY
ncbi:syndetin [Copidosoma floridanum]|uniref:syndetin n=1 Tax=Copidosoma floridanum TaxID=29053 RepID=UPI0006C955CF|nr:syndetin [Copidosoma floridanum]